MAKKSKPKKKQARQDRRSAAQRMREEMAATKAAARENGPGQKQETANAAAPEQAPGPMGGSAAEQDVAPDRACSDIAAAQERILPGIQPGAYPEYQEEPVKMPPDGIPYMRQPAGRKSSPVPMRLENAGSAGNDCWHFEVKLPRLADLAALFDGIRSTRPRDETGMIYVRTDVLGAGPASAMAAYAYKNGMFTRTGDSTKDAPALADMLGLPIVKIRAAGGWGRMDYYVNVAGENSDQAALAEIGG